MQQFETKKAIEHLLALGFTKYKIAKALNASPISVHHWLSKTKMSKAYADKMREVFSIEITDAFTWEK